MVLLPLLLLPMLTATSPTTSSGISPEPTAAVQVADSLAHYYAAQDPTGVARLLARARTREERLLCRYRLYPLTEDPALLADIPAADEARTAREAALIAALWGFRAAEAPAWRLPTYGRRSEAALDRARRLDPHEPYLLLVEGQSLLYRPALFGGDARAAQARFERLREVLGGRAVAGLPPVEAEVWVWMALRRQRSPEAEPLRRRLLARRPPPLFRQFLLDPP